MDNNDVEEAARRLARALPSLSDYEKSEVPDLVARMHTIACKVLGHSIVPVQGHQDACKWCEEPRSYIEEVGEPIASDTKSPIPDIGSIVNRMLEGGTGRQGRVVSIDGPVAYVAWNDGRSRWEDLSELKTFVADDKPTRKDMPT